MQKKNEQTMNRIFKSAEDLFSEKDFHDVKKRRFIIPMPNP